ncbi:hypothetical protein ACI0X9_003255 [Cronobacter turicensis]
MTDKRETGADYGHEEVKDRNENYESEVDSAAKKPKPKKNLFWTFVIAIIGVGALYPVFFDGKHTPKDKVEEVIPVNPDGTPDHIIESSSALQPNNVAVVSSANAVSSDQVSSDRAAADKATADKAAADKAAADKAASDKAAADKAASDKAAADKAAADKAASDKAAADKAAADKAASDKAAADNAADDKDVADKASKESATTAIPEHTESLAGVAQDKAGPPSSEAYRISSPLHEATDYDSSHSEQKLLDIASPSNPTADVIPSDRVVHNANSDELPEEDVKGIAKAVVSDPTVKATDEAQATVNTSDASKTARTPAPGEHTDQQYDPTKFGMGAEEMPSTSLKVQYLNDKQPQPQPQPRPQQEQLIQLENDPAQLNEPGTIKNYVGRSSEVVYEKQAQNTIYLYGKFAAKVYLLQLSKGETISSYLTDTKGWEVRQLPGNILRINRSDDRTAWTDATDLFLVAGKRTYSFILQAVERPQDRTDSLVFTTPEPVKSSKK